MERKRRGKYVEGHEPWTALGIKANTFHARVKVEGALGDEAREAKRKALEIAGTSADDAPDDEAGVVEQAPVEAPAPIQAPVVPAAPKPAPAPVRADPVTPSETMPRQAGATVNVTLRSAPAQHDRLRRMSFDTRRPIQDLVSTAVDEYLSHSGY